MTFFLIIQAVLLTVVISVFVAFLYQILFYGFVPFLPSRPEEIKKIVREIRIKHSAVVYSLGSGSSGFLAIMEEYYPNIELVGIENNKFLFLADKLQIFLKKSRIKIIREDYYWANIKKADIIYCYLNLKDMREIHRKLKIDTKPDALVISNGFIIPYMESDKVVELIKKKHWFSFLVRGREVVKASHAEDKRDNKIYFYQV